jgi:predicted nucleic acid-binding protein
MVIVDSSVWIDYYCAQDNAQTAWLDREMARLRLGLTDGILCKVLQASPSERRFSRTLEELSRFEIFDSGGEELATLSARNYRHLRSKGITVRTAADCLIATFCMEYGHSLLHRDRDFDAFEKHLGLSVVQSQGASTGSTSN